jgi:hypothetical protein
MMARAWGLSALPLCRDTLLYALPLLIGSNVYPRLVTWNPNCCQSLLPGACGAKQRFTSVYATAQLVFSKHQLVRDCKCWASVSDHRSLGVARSIADISFSFFLVKQEELHQPHPWAMTADRRVADDIRRPSKCGAAELSSMRLCSARTRISGISQTHEPRRGLIAGCD